MTVLPQNYQVTCQTIGENVTTLDMEYYYFNSSDGYSLMTSTECSSNGFDCTFDEFVLIDSSNFTNNHTVSVTWNANVITSGIFSQSTDDGDHTYRCLYYSAGSGFNYAEAEKFITVTGKLITCNE